MGGQHPEGPPSLPLATATSAAPSPPPGQPAPHRLTRRGLGRILALAAAAAAAGCARPAPVQAQPPLTVTPFGTLGVAGTETLLREARVTSVDGVPVQITNAVQANWPAADAMWLQASQYRYQAVGLSAILQPLDAAVRIANIQSKGLVAPPFMHVFDAKAATFGVTLVCRPIPVLTNKAMVERLALPPPPLHWTWDAFMIYLTAAGRVIAGGPPGTTVLGLMDLADSGMLWLLIACLLAAEGVPLPENPPWNTASAGAQAAFDAWADLVGPYAGGGRFAAGTALMMIGTGQPRPRAPKPTKPLPAATASYFPKFARPHAPADAWGLGARRRPELVARFAAALLAPSAQRALAVAVQAAPAAQAVRGFADWLPHGAAHPQPIAPMLTLEPGTEAITSPGPLGDPAFSDALYTLRTSDGRPAGRDAAIAALTRATKSIDSCTTCW